MGYGLVKYKEVDGLREPDLPEGLAVDVFTDLVYEDWGLFEIRGPQEHWPLEKVVPVDEELGRLISSGKMYLPALVLSMRDLADYRGGTHEYLRALKERLGHRLSSQKADPYLLARVRESDGELLEGSWRWVVWYDRAEKRVYWISPYYFVYDDRASCFDLSQEELESLPGVKFSV